MEYNTDFHLEQLIDEGPKPVQTSKMRILKRQIQKHLHEAEQLIAEIEVEIGEL